MYKALDIANFYIQLAIDLSDDSIDNLKINKLLYYAQGFALVILGRPLFGDDIQAWEYGPVIPEVYHTFKCCGRKSIDSPSDEFDEKRLDTSELELLINVYSSYGRYTGWALKEMTHVKNGPWDRVYEPGKNNLISLESMEDYFEKEKLNTFDILRINIPKTKVIPSAWDSDEDQIYE